MKTKYFHAIYLAIILIISILYFQKNNQLKEYEAVIERLSAQIRANEPILDNVMAWHFYELSRNIDAYPAYPIVKFKHFGKNILVNTQKTLAYLTILLYDLLKNHQSFLTDNQFDSLKNLLQTNLDTLNNANAIALDSIYLKYYQFLQERNGLDSLKHLHGKSLFAAISHLKNDIYKGGIIIMAGLNDRTTSSCFPVEYIIDFSTSKSIIIEGDTLNIGIVLKNLGKQFDFFDYTLKINDENIKFKNNKFVYNKIATKAGKYKINATMYQKNTLTGRMKPYFGNYEYEVFSKCRRECQ